MVAIPSRRVVSFYLGTMNKDTIIVSMTTWPPRRHCCVKAMQSLVQQKHSEPVHFVLVLSLEEFTENDEIVDAIKEMGVEIIWDEGNIQSHKKLIPTLERYPDNPILVVDDDMQQREGWLQAFIDDHKAFPSDIIYGHSSSVVEVIDGKIVEGIAQRGIHTKPGHRTYNEKPANGAAGTLYPPHTFTDARFFDRILFMLICPNSDETWQWAFAVIEGRTYRCLSKCNYPLPIGSNEHALADINMFRYTDYHNAIAKMFPKYKEKLIEIIKNKEL